MKVTSAGLGIALILVGFVIFISAGSAESGSIIQGAINAALEDDNPFHKISIIGLNVGITGCMLVFYWMFFGCSKK